MSRPLAENITFFPMNVDFFDDPKILRIEDKFGIKGSYIAIKIMMWIYRDGYYTKYTEDFPFIFAKRAENINGCGG